MFKLLPFLAAFFFSAFAAAQTALSGRVTDAKGNALVGANASVKDTYDGASTDAEGRFSFTTAAQGQITLTVSLIGYEPAESLLTATGQAVQADFTLREKASELNTVVITAGSFEASDTRKTTILKPLDIVTTAGANADLFTAIQTLPGAGRVGEEEGLFVRGGSAAETKTIIDGMIVGNPFFSATPDVPQRGRFSPFLFKETVFSTGGYSAQYGQALSSVLVLNTQDLPAQTQTGVGLTAIGPSLSHTQRWKRTSVAVDGSYTNLTPLFAVVRQNVDWQKAPEGLGGSLVFRHQPTPTSLLKVYSTYHWSGSALRFQDHFDFDRTNRFGIRNDNLYTNASYRNAFGAGKWVATAGLSYSHNADRIQFNTDRMGRRDERLQARATLSRVLSDGVTLLAGGEVHRYTFGNAFNDLRNRRQDVYSAFFVEAEAYLTRRLAGRLGLRNEYSQLIAAFNAAPRVSLAYKTGDYSQVAFAYGTFFQNPENRYLLVNPSLDFERAGHYILNYQVMKDKRTFRAEAYYKQYNHLVKEYNQAPFDPDRHRYPAGPTDNGGSGYARGVDLFWRDQKTFRNIDYWLSYSLLDTERDYQNFPVPAMPTFASRHNLSLVYKQFVSKIRSTVGLTYNFASGRPYYNPNAERFLGDRTRPFSLLGVNVSYLTQIRGHFTIVFVSANNVLGTKNIFGYRYAPDGTQRVAIGQPADRGFFVGTFVSIGQKPFWQEKAAS